MRRSYSYSKRNLLDKCPRAYYYKYYGSARSNPYLYCGMGPSMGRRHGRWMLRWTGGERPVSLSRRQKWTS